MRLRVPDGLMPVAGGEFVRVEARHVAHGEQGAVVGVEPSTARPEVDRRDTRGGVDAARFAGGVRDDLDLGSPSALAQ